MIDHKVSLTIRRSQPFIAGLFLLFVNFIVFLQSAHSFARLTLNQLEVFWQDSQARINLHLGCPSTPLPHWGPCWDDAAADALLRWNEVSQRFRFLQQTPAIEAGPCAGANHVDQVNTAIFADTICGMQFGSALAVTITVSNSNTGALLDADTLFNSALPWSAYPGPLHRNALGEVIEYDFHRVAVHEFGHTLGLAHPDTAGQQVSAIMNSRISSLYGLQSDDINGVNAIYPTTAPPPDILLENPASGTFVSGITVLSGWACDAQRIEVQFDNQPVQPVAYGTQRLDTIPVCGDDNNGFSLLVNWNNLGDGTHALVAFKNGVEFARRTFFVSTLGTAFLQGVTGTYRLPNFNGRDVIIEWRESLQSFVIIDTQ
jgi:hypothetical protein